VPYSKPQGEVGSCPRKKKDGWAFGYYVAWDEWGLQLVGTELSLWWVNYCLHNYVITDRKMEVPSSTPFLPHAFPSRDWCATFRMPQTLVPLPSPWEPHSASGPSLELSRTEGGCPLWGSEGSAHTGCLAPLPSRLGCRGGKAAASPQTIPLR
jgi:hypothetical protein